MSWRWFQRNGKQKLYKNNLTYQNHIKMICALAFVKNSKIVDFLERLTVFYLHTTVDPSILELFLG